MKRCRICNISLELENGNLKECKRHNAKIKGTPVIQEVTMSIDDYNKLKSDSEKLDKIRKYVKFLERTDL